MLNLTIAEAAEAMGIIGAGPEKLIQDFSSRQFPSVSIDSRTIQPGQAFFALQGERFDGHAYLEDAQSRGAELLVVSQDPERLGAVYLKVSDVTKALQNFGKHVRVRWGRPLIAITGSMGKTTTRHFIASILETQFGVYQSPGNFNNHIGLPFSLLQLEERHEFAVIELGMNHAGEIDLLSRLCLPTIAVLTNVAPVHIEFFESLDKIAEAKGEILHSLDPKGLLVFNQDDPRLVQLARGYPGNKISYGFHEEADVRITGYRFDAIQGMDLTIQSERAVYSGRVRFTGKHLLYNLAAAVATADYCGVSRLAVENAFEHLSLPEMRGQVYEMNGITLWDDSYNSNPDASKALIETIKELQTFKRRFLVLGDMLELGSHSARLHFDLGRCIPEDRIDFVITVGEASRRILEGAVASGFPASRASHFELATDASAFLAETAQPGDLIVVKGSRGMKMERIIQRLRGVFS